MGAAMQDHYEHHIPKTAKQIAPRINLTFRIAMIYPLWSWLDNPFEHVYQNQTYEVNDLALRYNYLSNGTDL